MTDLRSNPNTPNLDRRTFMSWFAGAGLSTSLFPGILWAKLQEQTAPVLTKESISQAEKMAGLEFTDQERDLMLEGLHEQLGNYKAIRQIHIDNSVPPAVHFNPLASGMHLPDAPAAPAAKPSETVQRPDDLEEAAFWPVTKLAALVESRQVTSTELTEMYLDRLRRFGPKLKCVITLTEELARKQAQRADEEIAAGNYRGPLHGIPWGAKDLLAVKGYPTTWGAMPYKEQMLDINATVVEKLEAAGAVLVAKLSMGALAWGDVWFGGKTLNPWNLEEGSSGSSAGPGSATAAGLVGFAIGSETWGSIVSPSTRCGVSGLRPTYGRVSRHGAMALSWSMDKLGPMCRSIEDCALVLAAIYGRDGQDVTVVDAPFAWSPEPDLSGLRIGYLAGAFGEEREKNAEWRAFDLQSLDVLRALGAKLLPIDLPNYPVGDIAFILSAEAGAAFDELTRSNRDDLLVRQIKDAWPNVFRQARMIPAVEYIQANRLRTKVMQAMAGLMSQIDVYVTPSFVGTNLLLTNLTGHPQAVVPNGFKANGSPTSISFVGGLFQEGRVLSVAHAYQKATDFHLKHPTLNN